MPEELSQPLSEEQEHARVTQSPTTSQALMDEASVVAEHTVMQSELHKTQCALAMAQAQLMQARAEADKYRQATTKFSTQLDQVKRDYDKVKQDNDRLMNYASEVKQDNDRLMNYASDAILARQDLYALRYRHEAVCKQNQDLMQIVNSMRRRLPAPPAPTLYPYLPSASFPR